MTSSVYIADSHNFKCPYYFLLTNPKWNRQSRHNVYRINTAMLGGDSHKR